MKKCSKNFFQNNIGTNPEPNTPKPVLKPCKRKSNIKCIYIITDDSKEYYDNCKVKEINNK